MTTEEGRKLSLQVSIREKNIQKRSMFKERLKFAPRSELRRLCVKLCWWNRRALNDLRSHMVEIK